MSRHYCSSMMNNYYMNHTVFIRKWLTNEKAALVHLELIATLAWCTESLIKCMWCFACICVRVAKWLPKNYSMYIHYPSIYLFFILTCFIAFFEKALKPTQNAVSDLCVKHTKRHILPAPLNLSCLLNSLFPHHWRHCYENIYICFQQRKRDPVLWQDRFKTVF